MNWQGVSSLCSHRPLARDLSSNNAKHHDDAGGSSEILHKYHFNDERIMKGVVKCISFSSISGSSKHVSIRSLQQGAKNMLHTIAKKVSPH
jgi:hypothetical protein